MMNKGILKMLISSTIGGVIVAVIFLSVSKLDFSGASSSNHEVSLTNYVFDSTDFVVPEGLNFVFAAKSAIPSVVHIRTIYKNGKSGNSQFNEFFKDYFGDRFRDYQDAQRGAGSGVVMTADGFIVTNNHVIEDASEIQVVLNDNRSYKAEVVGADPSTDIALIKIDESNLKPVEIGSSENIQIGEWVLAIGNPFEFRSTVTAGIVSAKGRSINILRERSNLSIESFIQTDAAVNPGNSGGALVNLRGELVGINTAIASPTGAFAGYSFAVPVSLVQKVVDDLAEFGTVQRALLGISIQDIDATLAEQNDLNLLKGVFVQGVGVNSSAEEAGLESGDVIVAIDGKKVATVAELQELVALNRPGDRIKVTYIRDGSTKESYATLQNNYGTTNVVEVDNSFSNGGAQFEEASTEMLRELNLDGGVTVKGVENGVWEKAGIREGFIVTRINKVAVENLEQFVRIIKGMDEEGILIAGYYPNGDKAYYGIELE